MEVQPHILVVDDDRVMLALLTKVLEQAGYTVTAMASPSEALAAADTTTFGVVLVDYKMPEMSGLDLMDELKLKVPDARFVMVTGQKDLLVAINAINQGRVFRYLNKPWSEADLLESIRAAFEDYSRLVIHKAEQERIQEEHSALKEQVRTLRKKVIERTMEVARLAQVAEDGFKTALQSMAGLPKVGAHGRRVGTLARRLGEVYGLGEQELVQLEVAGALHDIGKIRIPLPLLQKTYGYLSPKEVTKLRMHPIHSETIINMAPNMGHAAQYARHHHERFDGQGYPDKLKGEAIPLGARIIAVANAYDKARHLGPTRVTPAQAYLEVQSRWVTEFDPALVEALSQLLPRRHTAHAPDRGAVKREEMTITVNEVEPGMILSRDLVSPQGVVLLVKDRPVARHKLNQLIRFHHASPIETPIFIYKDTPAKHPMGKPMRIAG